MPHPKNLSSRGAVMAVGLALAATGLSPVAAWSNPAGTGPVISEVFAGGGNTGAPYAQDFVEIHNPTTEPLDVTGYQLEYYSAAGNAQGAVTLTGVIPAGGHHVVRYGSASATVGAPLPEPYDRTVGSSNLGSSNGALELRAEGEVLDLVGYGTATRKEGAAATYGGNTESLQRTAGKDTDNNAADFTKAAPTPGAARDGAPPQTPDDPDNPDAPGTDALRTIAEIQGTGATTPFAGRTVKTRGVVTAAYAEGGFDGFYIQTPGPDTTPEASDALFVRSPGFPDSVRPGVSVEVTGTASEDGNLTRVSAAAGGITVLAESLGQVVPKTEIPGTACALPGSDCPTAAQRDAAREKVEGEVLDLAGDFTVTDVHDGSPFTGGNPTSSNFGELALAVGSTEPLRTITDVVDPRDAAAVAARTAYNDTHRIVLDDGSSTNFSNAAATGSPVPWQTADHTVRVGAAVTFPDLVVLDHRFGWRLQPTSRVVGAPSATQPQFEQDRAAPEQVKGELKLASFNVLNYFTTLGEEKAQQCTSYKDRNGVPVTVNRCDSIPNGPRGAWGKADLERQQKKIVTAINSLDADVVSLEEVENSRVVDGGDRDEAIGALVDALNAAAGEKKWAYAASPANLPADEDVIRTGIIYSPSTVETVGEAEILVGNSAFDNARQPFAQAFRPVGGQASETFAVIVNHFKSKGSGVDDGTGQGKSNPDRVAQAKALVTFADGFGERRGTEKVFLSGDFNAYSKEDPVVELEKAGYERLDSTFPGAESSYSFDGMSGSLDHIFASKEAAAWVEEVDVWEANANETVYRQYSRHNYNVAQLVDGTAFAASDHNPGIVGFTPGGSEAPNGRVELQLLATNDFHGRLGAAAALAGAVGELRTRSPHTLFVGVGDQVGASTFESFISKDRPTVDVLNAMDLAVSAAGNHEFDAGAKDLTDRLMAPRSAENPDGGAQWQYLAANVRKKGDGSLLLGDTAASPGTSDGATWMTEIDGAKVGFIGAVTEDLPALVSPTGIKDLDITSIVDEVNAAADRLTADGADAVVLLAHEGAQDVKSDSASDVSTVFGKIVAGVDDDVDAIFSGHTHLRYAHTIGGRPVISAGEYGSHLARTVLSIDPATDTVEVKANEVVEVASVPAKAPEALELQREVAEIVEKATADANVLGARPLGEIDAPLRRAVLGTGAENRGGESTLGNTVAEMQRWATRGAEQGGAQIGFMNPGGLRTDMVGNATDGYPAVVTYKQAAAVQPFANTLVNMDLTGATIKKVLEQQWQRDAQGNVPTRPFLRLGVSDGFTYTYDESREQGDRITGMWLNGKAIGAETTYSVTANSFLASGGDNFRAFGDATKRQDTGQSDLQAAVDYMAAHTPLKVDTKQRAVGVAGIPAGGVAPGSSLELAVSSWSFSAPGSVQDEEVELRLGNDVIGRGALDNTVAATPDDVTGRATVRGTLPASVTPGAQTLTLRGTRTGTEIQVPVNVKASAVLSLTGPVPSAVVGEPVILPVKVALDGAALDGMVTARVGEQIVGGARLEQGSARLSVAPFSSPGERTVTLTYQGAAATGGEPLTATLDVPLTVVAGDEPPPLPDAEKTDPKLTVRSSPRKVAVKSGKTTVDVEVSGGKGTPSGNVLVLQGNRLLGVKALSDGRASVSVTGLRGLGKASLRVRYLGDDQRRAATVRTELTVVKATPKVSLTAPKKVRVGDRRAVTVSVRAAGHRASGAVKVKVRTARPGSQSTVVTRVVKLRNGKARVSVPFSRVGTARVTATFLSNKELRPKKAAPVTVRVVRR